MAGHAGQLAVDVGLRMVRRLAEWIDQRRPTANWTAFGRSNRNWRRQRAPRRGPAG